MIAITSTTEKEKDIPSKGVTTKEKLNFPPTEFPYPSSAKRELCDDVFIKTNMTRNENSNMSKTGLFNKFGDDETNIYEDGVMSKPPEYEMEDSDNESESCNIKTLSPFATTYELEKYEKNLLVIFNQVNFKGFDTRVGTDKDVMALRRTFNRFGFEVTVVTDATRDEIFSRLDEFAEKDFTNYGCVAVVILTYGFKGGKLEATNPPNFTEGDVLKRVMNKNPTLITKPKIVIFQAGKGENHLAGMRHEESLDMVNKNGTDENELYTLPVESDLLVIHSSFPGKDSHRTQSGSWFIQTLCNKINEFAHAQDLESILVEVKKSVALMEARTFNKSKGILEISKQMPVITSTLIRKLYLRRYQDNSTSSHMKKQSINENFENDVATQLLNLLKQIV